MFLASVGARDQALVAQLGGVQGRRPALLIVALVVAGASAALAAWFGGRMLGPLAAPAARELFGAVALLLAGGEMLALAPRPAPAEPTHSLFASGLVLMGLQVTDAARFLVLALAVGTAAPLPAGMGGAVGGMAALTLGWSAPQLLAAPSARIARRVLGAVLLVIGLAIAVPNVIGITA